MRKINYLNFRIFKLQISWLKPCEVLDFSSSKTIMIDVDTSEHIHSSYHFYVLDADLL